jgi:hypothetical protein
VRQGLRNPYSPDGLFPEVVYKAPPSRERRIELEEQIEGKICRECRTKPGVAIIKGEYVLRCGCYPSPPVLRKPPTQKQQIAERLGEMVGENLPAVREVMAPATTGVESAAPMTIEQFKTRQELVRYVVFEMQENIHYGVIPGTTDRSLWEPGAEYLRAAFNISWSHDVLEQVEDFEGHEYRYKIHAYQLLGPDIKGPGWTATCWSKEKRFNNMEKEMLPHNVMDRALKRAFVAMIRNVTGTTGYFKQALDAGDADGAGVGTKNDMLCPVHKKTWFKTGRMTDFAHPIEGEVGARGGKVWCNREQALAELKDSGGELPADAAPATKPEKVLQGYEDGAPKDKGDLYARCHKRWEKSVAEVNGVLNIQNADGMGDLGVAWATVLAFWGPDADERHFDPTGAEENVSPMAAENGEPPETAAEAPQEAS